MPMAHILSSECLAAMGCRKFDSFSLLSLSYSRFSRALKFIDYQNFFKVLLMSCFFPDLQSGVNQKHLNLTAISACPN